MKIFLSTLVGVMALGSAAMATSISDCPNGTWPVAQYDWRGNFKGYKCEKYNDH